MMESCIGFAAAGQENELNSILTGHGMGLAGDIDEHVVLTAEGKVLGGGLLWQLDQGTFHLLVLGVRQEGRGKGYGSRLLREISANPWQYCRDAADRLGDAYRITTVARGEAVSFYRQCGFRSCDAAEFPPLFGGQCDECPDRGECKPEMMVFFGGIGQEERNSF